MGRYIITRMLQAAFVVLGVYTVTFVFIQLLPSDPIIIFLAKDGNPIDPEVYNRLSHAYGYDRPLYEQYVWNFLDLLQGNFGFSLSAGQPVLERIVSNGASTVQLAGAALTFALLIAAALAVAFFHARSAAVRNVLHGVPELFSAIPVFWLGLVALHVLSIQLGLISLFPNPSFLSLLVPAIVLAIPVSAPISRVLIHALAEARTQPYVKTAWAKGVPVSRVLTHHVVRNVLGTVFTVIALVVGQLLAGSVITESVFGRRGLGSVLIAAVVNRDLPLVQGLVMLIAALVVVLSLVADVLLLALDPRTRRTRARSGETVALGA